MTSENNNFIKFDFVTKPIKNDFVTKTMKFDFHYQKSCECELCKNTVKCSGMGKRHLCLICNGTLKLICIHDIHKIVNGIKINDNVVEDKDDYNYELVE